MPIVGILALSFIGFFFFQFIKKKPFLSKTSSWHPGEIFVVTLIIAFFLSLMIWNYRPLRYQIILIYAACGAAALLLKHIALSNQTDRDKHIPYFAAPFIFCLMYPVVFQLYGTFVVDSATSFYWDTQKYITAAIAILLNLIIFLTVSFYKKYEFHFPAYIRNACIIIAVGGAGIISIPDYISWDERPTFTTRDNSIDFNLLLSKNAVISGPYAAALNLETDYVTIIHMFGVSQADPELFRKYPITHLLLDSGNEEKAKEDYPQIMDSARHLMTYHLGLQVSDCIE